MSRPFYFIGCVLITFSVLLALAGMMTYAFDSAPGFVESYSHQRVDRSFSRDVIGAKHGKFVSAASSRKSVRYSYVVDGKKYPGAMTSAGLTHLSMSPFKRMDWELILDRGGTQVTVYFLRWAPTFAVLHRGVDWSASLVLFALGIGCVRLSRWFNRKVEYNQEAAGNGLAQPQILLASVTNDHDDVE